MGRKAEQIVCTSITLTSGEDLKTNFTVKFAQAIKHAERSRKMHEKNRTVMQEST